MTVLILAAGAGTRWSFGKPKQLLPIQGEPLLSRTIRQVRQRMLTPTVVAINPKLLSLSASCLVPKNHRWTAETLLSTQELWDSQTVVLLGDVVYSAAALDTILNDNAILTYYLVKKKSRNQLIKEIVGLSFSQKAIPTIVEACHYVVKQAEEKTKDALLLHLLNAHPTGICQTVFIQDWTQDFDRLEDYQNFDMSQADELLNEPGLDSSD